MPGRILTESERERLEQFPAEITSEDVVTYFTLSASELELVRTHRGNHNRLGFALQLLILRYLGFCPDELTTAPATVVAYVAEQLGVMPDVLAAYGERTQTRTDHFLEVQAYLGFRRAGLRELRTLSGLSPGRLNTISQHYCCRWQVKNSMLRRLYAQG